MEGMEGMEGERRKLVSSLQECMMQAWREPEIPGTGQVV